MTPEDFSHLLRSRRSTRDFLPTAVPQDVLDAIFDDALQSPSWSNTQPYRIAVATGEVRDRIAKALTANFDAGMRALDGGALGKLKAFVTREGMPDGDFKVNFEYPKDLTPARRATGFGLYKLLGIDRHDRPARNAQMRKNFEFFGAPVALFLVIDRRMGRGQWAHLGMFMQSIALAAVEAGLGTCMQEAWASLRRSLHAHFALPDEEMIYCAIALGRPDPEAAVNRLRSEREPVESFTSFRGFP